MTTADLHLLTGAYALHALSEAERRTFEEHLAGCEACAQESAELSATAARLALATSGTPRPVMREHVLRRITTVRQVAPGEELLPPSGRPVPRARLLSRWALAACLAATVTLGGTALWQHERAEDALEEAQHARQDGARIAAVLTAPDARSRAAELADGATATIVVSASRNKAVLVASAMARPPRGKAYQLWFDDDGIMRSAGLMDPGRSDQALLLRGAVDTASGMGITLEPAGGSEQPTSAPLARMKLPA
ncbi:anti-sigma factor [Streptomyces sp. Root1310]|uniref:anti-sigma factor n=1 Tax=Streptomyces sp. Root1310 TaxID=1736452 RepID=UPI00070BC23B|nr:anti-sigma factor [Streptomyces sp. Root1310]KQX73128.1 anti-sigma factor [Streptomyces sp. Root1310]